MENNMEIKFISLIIKTSIFPLIAWFFTPIYDFIVLLVVQDYSALTPNMQALLNDSKLIMGVLVIFLALIKVVLGSIKMKKELDILNKNKQS